jgi:DNA processing protein
MDESKIPKILREIPDPPKKLYIQGVLPSHDEYIYLTVIGSRKFTSYGKQACEHLLAGLAGYPFVIVSGLALGIDSIAHNAALENKLITVSVPGSGLNSDVLYPASNRGLAKRIIESGGCMVSEYEPNFKATNWSFPKRNRIMAGISHAVLVIEAENISGTRITSRLATEYNRDVFAVPGSIFSTASAGCNNLIREGATPITSVQNILEYFNLDTKKSPSQSSFILEPQEQKIINCLQEPRSRNSLADVTKMNIIQINILLSSMEIKGYITEYMGKIQKK